MNPEIKKLKELGKIMLATKHDGDVLNFKRWYSRCISGNFGADVKVAAYRYFDEIVKQLAKLDDKEFQFYVLK